MTTRKEFLKTLGALSLGAWTLPSFAARSSLENEINYYVRKERVRGRVKSFESTAWTVFDLTVNKNVVSINSEQALQCASLIKPFVIQAYLYCHHKKSKKRYPLTPNIISEMRKVIVFSDNKLTSLFMQRMGGANEVEKILKQQAPQIFRHVKLVEYIPPNGQTYRNRASAGDYQRFLHAIWNNKIVGAQLIKTLMALPNADRLKQGTKQIPASARIYDKTGSTSMLCGNIGIIEAPSKIGKSHSYIITGIIESRVRSENYRQWISDKGNLIREISDIVYLHFKKQYSLI